MKYNKTQCSQNTASNKTDSQILELYRIVENLRKQNELQGDNSDLRLIKIDNSSNTEAIRLLDNGTLLSEIIIPKPITDTPSNPGNVTVLYESSIADGTLITEDLGSVDAGTPIDTLKRDAQGNKRTLSEVIDLLALKEVPARISTSPTLNLSSQDTNTREVGSIYSDSVVHIALNRGVIQNGDNTSAGPVIGNLNNVKLESPTGQIQLDQNTSSNNVTVSIPNWIIRPGNNVFRFLGFYNPGTSVYTNNTGQPIIVPSIESIKNSRGPLFSTINVTGRYYRYIYMGDRGSSPTSVTQIRNLTNKQFLNSRNEDSFLLTVPAFTSEITVYTVSGKNLRIVNTGNGSTIAGTGDTLQSQQTAFTMKDAANNDVNYTSNKIDLGLRGFTSNAAFTITITN